MIVCAWVMQIPLMGWLQSDSLVHRHIINGGPMGPVFLVLLFLLAGMGLADIAFNDFRRARTLPTVLHQRHNGFMVMAMMLVLLSGVVCKHEGLTPFVVSFWLPAMFCVVIVPLDMMARHRGGAWLCGVQ